MSTKLGALSVFLTADTSPFARKMKSADGKVKQLSATTVAFGAAAGAAFAGAAIKLRDFTAEALTASKRLAEVNTLLQIEPKGMEALKRELFDIGTELGILTEDSIPALYQAISAGIPRENVIDFLKVAGKSAKAGVTTMETSVDGLTSIIDAYSLSVQDAEMVSDKFLQAVVSGKTKFEFLAEGIGKVAPLASTLNVSLDELFGIMVSLTKVGLNTDEAFTGFRGVLNAMLKPTDDLAKMFEELAGQGKASNVQTDGLLNVMKELQKAVDNDSKALAKLFPNVRGLNAAFAILKNEAKDTSKYIDQSAQSAARTGKMFKKIAEDESFSMEQAAANWEQIKINIGDIVKESGLIGFLTKVSELTKNISKDLQDVTKKTFKFTDAEKEDLNDVIQGRKDSLTDLIQQVFKTTLSPLTKPFTAPIAMLNAASERRYQEAESKRLAKIQEKRDAKRQDTMRRMNEIRRKEEMRIAQEQERLSEIAARNFERKYSGEASRIMKAIRGEQDAEAANKAFDQRIKSLRLELKLADLIAKKKEKEAFILQRIASFGDKITEEQRKTIAKLAGELFDTQNVKDKGEEQMKGPALSEAIRAGSRAETALVNRTAFGGAEKMRKRNVDANVATAREMKLQNQRGVKVTGMKVVEKVL